MGQSVKDIIDNLKDGNNVEANKSFDNAMKENQQMLQMLKRLILHLKWFQRNLKKNNAIICRTQTKLARKDDEDT